jgi:D-alanyl-D-alanine dipeptidase
MGRAVLLIAMLLTAAADAEEARSARFVDAGRTVTGLRVDMRYAGRDNFVGRRIRGYRRPVCLLTREAATALRRVQRDLSQRGLGLKVFDCYRPARAVAHFMGWAADPKDQRRKRDYFPEVDKADLVRLGYLAERSSHSRGSTVDVTLVRAGAGPLLVGGELDMGTRHDFFSPRSSPSNTSVSPAAQANRRLLAEAMAKRGFRPYDKEWWHFTLQNEPFPDTYFDFPVE